MLFADYSTHSGRAHKVSGGEVEGEGGRVREVPWPAEKGVAAVILLN